MYFDDALMLGGGGVRVLFIIPRGEQLKYMFQILFEVSNNEAEYEVLLHGLHLAVSLGIKQLLIYGDSLLVVQQVNKEWDINKDTMDSYITEIHKLENKFLGLEIHHVIHDKNVGADVLSKFDSDRANVSLRVQTNPTESLDDRGQLEGGLHRLHLGAQTTPRRQPKRR
jgi:ribonuclease HI